MTNNNNAMMDRIKPIVQEQVLPVIVDSNKRNHPDFIHNSTSNTTTTMTLHLWIQQVIQHTQHFQKRKKKNYSGIIEVKEDVVMTLDNDTQNNECTETNHTMSESTDHNINKMTTTTMTSSKEQSSEGDVPIEWWKNCCDRQLISDMWNKEVLSNDTTVENNHTSSNIHIRTFLIKLKSIIVSYADLRNFIHNHHNDSHSNINTQDNNTNILEMIQFQVNIRIELWLLLLSSSSSKSTTTNYEKYYDQLIRNNDKKRKKKKTHVNNKSLNTKAIHKKIVALSSKSSQSIIYESTNTTCLHDIISILQLCSFILSPDIPFISFLRTTLLSFFDNNIEKTTTESNTTTSTEMISLVLSNNNNVTLLKLRKELFESIYNEFELPNPFLKKQSSTSTSLSISSIMNPLQMIIDELSPMKKPRKIKDNNKKRQLQDDRNEKKATNDTNQSNTDIDNKIATMDHPTTKEKDVLLSSPPLKLTQSVSLIAPTVSTLSMNHHHNRTKTQAATTNTKDQQLVPKPSKVQTKNQNNNSTVGIPTATTKGGGKASLLSTFSRSKFVGSHFNTNLSNAASLFRQVPMKSQQKNTSSQIMNTNNKTTNTSHDNNNKKQKVINPQWEVSVESNSTKIVTTSSTIIDKENNTNDPPQALSIEKNNPKSIRKNLFMELEEQQLTKHNKNNSSSLAQPIRRSSMTLIHPVTTISNSLSSTTNASSKNNTQQGTQQWLVTSTTQNEEEESPPISSNDVILQARRSLQQRRMSQIEKKRSSGSSSMF